MCNLSTACNQNLQHNKDKLNFTYVKVQPRDCVEYLVKIYKYVLSLVRLNFSVVYIRRSYLKTTNRI